MSSSTPQTHSMLRRKTQVYVEIPPSPLHTFRPSVTSPSLVSNPLSPTRSNMPQLSDATTKKRKLSNPQLPSAKKQKQEIKSHTQKENTLATPSADECATTNQGPGTYCHQCGRKREFADLVFCTTIHTSVKTGKERRCVAKYCQACIRNRYSQDSESTKAAARNAQKIPSKYTCPKCRNICNCSQCRKAKGLEPLGKQSSRSGAQANGNDQVKKLVSKPKPVVKEPLLALSNNQPKPIPSTKPLPKPLPKVEWQNLPVQLSLDEVEARIQIREFVLRFETTVGRNMGKVNLEELECITGNNDEDTAINWVSEGCVKAVMLGLLGTLANEEDSSAAMVIQKTMKEIRSAGINLSKIWASLAALREVLCTPNDDAKSAHSDDSESSEDRIIIEFPDPLPPPDNTVINTRSTRSASSQAASPTVAIVSTSQLIPVILGLISIVVESNTIREELDEGVKRGKEATREVREGIKNENEKWEQLKQIHEALPPEVAITKVKEDRHRHKENIQGLESSLKVVLSSSVPRFSPLGTDHDGRVYYALSPGVHDREFAASLISAASGTTKSTKGRKPIRRPKSVEERASCRSWSWFIAVWGKPPSLGRPSEIDDGLNGGEDGWWVFWEPEEIRKLSSWITIRNGLDAKPEDGVGTRKQQLRNLVKNLQDYSTTLEWRCSGGEEML
ncbi:hypothetical protein L218DRAFT_959427 [Marasmius fiardii PR-910]|nr:hypothetical protein L218DRAFT_959427 [Marasmius fiardii PR-910]